MSAFWAFWFTNHLHSRAAQREEARRIWVYLNSGQAGLASGLLKVNAIRSTAPRSAVILLLPQVAWSLSLSLDGLPSAIVKAVRRLG